MGGDAGLFCDPQVFPRSVKGKSWGTCDLGGGGEILSRRIYDYAYNRNVWRLFLIYVFVVEFVISLFLDKRGLWGYILDKIGEG